MYRRQILRRLLCPGEPTETPRCLLCGKLKFWSATTKHHCYLWYCQCWCGLRCTWTILQSRDWSGTYRTWCSRTTGVFCLRLSGIEFSNWIYIRPFIEEERVLCQEVGCAMCLTLYAKKPWRSMQIYKTNSTVKIVCNDLVLYISYGACKITHGFVQRVWPMQRQRPLFLQGAPIRESAGSIRKDLDQEMQPGCP